MPDVPAWFDDAEYAGGSHMYHEMARERWGEGCNFLARLNGEPLVLVDVTPDHWGGWITLVVDPQHRNEGIGAATLRGLVGLPELAAERLVGRIEFGNPASLASFRKAGYGVSRVDHQDEYTVVHSRPLTAEERAEIDG